MFHIEIKKPEHLLPFHAVVKYSLLLGVRSIHPVLLSLLDLVSDRVTPPIPASSSRLIKILLTYIDKDSIISTMP